MIKAMIFDADGMVCSNKMFSLELEKQYGVPIKKVLPFFKNEFPAIVIGKGDLKEKLAGYFDEWGWKGTVDEFTDFWFKTEHEIDEDLPGKIKELRSKGVKCYLGTNQEKYRTNYMKNEMGFGDLFDDVFSSAYLGVKNPG